MTVAIDNPLAFAGHLEGAGLGQSAARAVAEAFSAALGEFATKKEVADSEARTAARQDKADEKNESAFEKVWGALAEASKERNQIIGMMRVGLAVLFAILGVVIKIAFFSQ